MAQGEVWGATRAEMRSSKKEQERALIPLP
jgi:hypothetical protein